MFRSLPPSLPVHIPIHRQSVLNWIKCNPPTRFLDFTLVPMGLSVHVPHAFFLPKTALSLVLGQRHRLPFSKEEGDIRPCASYSLLTPNSLPARFRPLLALHSDRDWQSAFSLLSFCYYIVIKPTLFTAGSKSCKSKTSFMSL